MAQGKLSQGILVLFHFPPGWPTIMGEPAGKDKSDLRHGTQRKSQVFFFPSRSLSALKKPSFPLLKEKLLYFKLPSMPRYILSDSSFSYPSLVPVPGTFESPHLGCFPFLAPVYCSHLQMVWVTDGQVFLALLEALKASSSLRLGLTIIGVSGLTPCPQDLGLNFLGW